MTAFSLYFASKRVSGLRTGLSPNPFKNVSFLLTLLLFVVAAFSYILFPGRRYRDARVLENCRCAFLSQTGAEDC